MIEAYEVGIRIALDDGVSAGVQAMARELAELNRVVDGSMMKLAVLRGAAAALAPETVRAEPVNERAPDEPAVIETAPHGAPAAKIPDERPPAAAAEVPRSPPAPVAPEAEAPRRSVETEHLVSTAITTDPATVVLPPPPAIAPSAPAQEAAPRPPQPDRLLLVMSPAASGPKPAEAPRQMLSARPSPRTGPQTSPEITRVATAPTVDPARAPARPPAPSEPFRPPPHPAAAIAPVVARPGPSSGPRQADAWLPLAARQAAASSPAATQAPVAPAARASASAAPIAMPRGAEAQASAERPPTNVHVYLDGAPLGRWIEDHLGRLAGRPPASTTGFDPRVGPAWPGAPIG